VTQSSSCDLSRDSSSASSGAAEAVLYVVATPIGNLDDMTARAVKILQSVDIIAAEDTRHSRALCQHFSIDTALLPYHEHSGERSLQGLFDRLLAGQRVALISDAGTPLIADPGYKIVRMARAQGIAVVPVPGACALISALSVAGLPTDRFVFEGFLPAKAEAREKKLRQLEKQPRTLLFYEAPHRIEATVAAMCAVFGGQREAVLAREITKRYETIFSGCLSDIGRRLAADSDQRRGEMVLVVRGCDPLDDEAAVAQRADEVLSVLLEALPVKQATAMAVKLTGIKKNYLYARALELGKVVSQKAR